MMSQFSSYHKRVSKNKNGGSWAEAFHQRVEEPSTKWRISTIVEPKLRLSNRLISEQTIAVQIRWHMDHQSYHCLIAF